MNDPVFIEMPEDDEPLNFVGEIAVSALALACFAFIVSVAFVL